MMSEKLKLLEEAMANNELFEFLSGANKKYYLVCPYAEMPTDPDQAFDAIKEYYQKTQSQSIWASFENEINEMSTTIEGAWLSVYYLSMYLSYRKYSGKDFINLSKLIKSVENGINNFKKELLGNKKWVGKDFEGGLFADAIRLIGILNPKFGINIEIKLNT